MTTYTDEQLKRALAKMLPGQIHTDTEINIAIAEACGWKHHKKSIVLSGGWPIEESWWTNRDGISEPLPSYTTDLNAMHEAEKTLNGKGVEYATELKAVMLAAGFGFGPQPEHYLWHATARQRAEAFLRTIGKWKE